MNPGLPHAGEGSFTPKFFACPSCGQRAFVVLEVLEEREEPTETTSLVRTKLARVLPKQLGHIMPFCDEARSVQLPGGGLDGKSPYLLRCLAMVGELGS